VLMAVLVNHGTYDEVMHELAGMGHSCRGSPSIMLAPCPSSAVLALPIIACPYRF